MSDNMSIWNAVSKTNPANTEKVSQRGGFTSICAQSQIMEATRQFGPIGVGWGYEAADPIFHDNLVFVRVMLWHGRRDNSFGPVTGGAEWKNNKGYLDSDAPKKATTDALTKLLSQLGFNADVFLGLYDDNKYVERVAREFSAAKEMPDDQWAKLVQLVEATNTNVPQMFKALKIDATDLRGITEDEYPRVIDALEKKLAKAETEAKAKEAADA